MLTRLRTLLIAAVCLVASLSPACAQTASAAERVPCIRNSASDVRHGVVQMWHGLSSAPRNAVRKDNLKWELPILGATGVLIGTADESASRHIQSRSLSVDADRWSNIGLALELGTAVITYSSGCLRDRESARSAGFTALQAMGYAAAEDFLLKAAFRRDYPAQAGSEGHFFGNGYSFPSGHAAASWAFASVIAHRYPHKRWLKWGAYALATGVSLSRFPAKKHFPSDILVGSTLGYVTGAYLSSR